MNNNISVSCNILVCDVLALEEMYIIVNHKIACGLSLLTIYIRNLGCLLCC